MIANTIENKYNILLPINIFRPSNFGNGSKWKIASVDAMNIPFEKNEAENGNSSLNITNAIRFENGPAHAIPASSNSFMFVHLCPTLLTLLTFRLKLASAMKKSFPFDIIETNKVIIGPSGLQNEGSLVVFSPLNENLKLDIINENSTLHPDFFPTVF